MKQTDLSDAEINDLIEKRNVARQQKNWVESDKIRDYLKEHNIILKDMKDKVEWEILK